MSEIIFKQLIGNYTKMARILVGAASSRENKSCVIAKIKSSRLEAAPTTKIADITIIVSFSIKPADF